MFERRPVWGLILVLNVCIVIWRISVQEPAMLEAEAMSSSAAAALSASNSFVAESSADKQQQQQHNAPVVRTVRSGFVAADAPQLQYAGKHLLGQRTEARENVAKVIQRAAAASGGGEPTTSHELSPSSSWPKSHKPLSSSSSSSSSVRSSDKFSSNKQSKDYNAYAVSSTPAPLVTVATLRNVGELQPPSTSTPAISTAIQQQLLALPPKDATQLIDLRNFTYLMNQPRCSGHIEALILVHSAPGNREKRAIIRETWGAIGKLPKWEGIAPLRVVFLLGAVGDRALQQQLEQENALFGDMVQGSFVDDYRNMTYKHVMALKWFLYNCAHAQILMKVDDDVYVNTPQLLMYWRNQRLNLKTANSAITNPYNNSRDSNNTTNTEEFNDVTYSNDIANTHLNTKNASYSPQFNASQELFRHPQNLLFCEANLGAKVKRTYRSKWRVAPEEFGGRYYPPYCPGYAIIYSPDVVLRLYREAQRTKYFWIDDVHITGVLAQKLNINITPSQAYILYEKVCHRLLAQQLHSGDIGFVYAWHLVKPQEMRALWTLYLTLAERQFATNVDGTAARAISDYAQDKSVS